MRDHWRAFNFLPSSSVWVRQGFDSETLIPQVKPPALALKEVPVKASDCSWTMDSYLCALPVPLARKEQGRISNGREWHFTNHFVLQEGRRRLKTTGPEPWPALKAKRKSPRAPLPPQPRSWHTETTTAQCCWDVSGRSTSGRGRTRR